jgi:hypothetical protein
MGECDKLNEHISAYLENTLDPAARKEFEQGLVKFSALKHTTSHILKLTTMLAKLPGQKCSDDFVPGLRQRINSAPASKFNEQNIKRYSFAFSIVLVVLAAMVGLNTLLRDDEPAPPLPAVNEFQPAPAPVSAGSVNPSSSGYSPVGGTEVDIKTRAESNMATDSSTLRIQEQKNSQAKQVGHIAE